MQSGRERLAAYRDRSRLKQTELATLLGMTDSYLSQVLSGRRRPGLDTALRIEEQTGVPVESWGERVIADAERRLARRARKHQLSKELPSGLAG